MDANYENSGDDDSFYAELRKQILLLTTDDGGGEEDDIHDHFRNDQRSKISRSIKINNINGFSAAKSRGRYYDWTENDKTNNSVPNWLLNLWRNRDTNGTGVFIPDVNVKSRTRNNKPRRRKNDKGRMYKPVPN